MTLRPLLLTAPLLLLPLGLRAAPTVVPAESAEYTLVKGPDGSFQDRLMDRLSRGWKPVGGVSVTVWNNALYFAQLLQRPRSR
jgi:hypothetical protein